MSGRFKGAQRYLHIAPEASYGATPVSPSYLLLPFETYDVKATPRRRDAQPFVGLLEERYGENIAVDVAGNLVCPLYGWQDASNDSLAEHLIAWAFSNPTSVDMASKLCEVFDNDNDNKRHNGLIPNTMSLTGNPDGILLSLGLIGQAETGGITEQVLDQTVFPEKSTFLFKDATFTIDTVAAKLAQFVITRENNLQPDRLMGSGNIDSLTAGTRRTMFQFMVRKTADTYDALRRSYAGTEAAFVLTLKGKHNGTGATGNYTTVTFTFPRGSFIDATEENSDRNALVSQSPNYHILKPATTDPSVTITYGESA